MVVVETVQKDTRSDLIEAIIKAMVINEDFNRSQQSFMNIIILNYGKDLGKGNRKELEQK